MEGGDEDRSEPHGSGVGSGLHARVLGEGDGTDENAEQAEKRQPGEGGFVGSTQDKSSDYLTKGEQDQDFAPEGQGAQDTSAGSSDVETGQSQDRDSRLDDGSESDR